MLALPDNSAYSAWLDALKMQRVYPDRHRRPELTIGILLTPRFPLLSLAGIVETLRHAGDRSDESRRIRCDWRIMGTPGQPIEASSGFGFVPDIDYSHPQDFDYIAVVGGLLADMASTPERHRDYLKMAAAAEVPLIGVCTGSFLLAAAGLLEGRRVCAHPFHLEDFRHSFPRHSVISGQNFVIDNDRITVAGGTSILALMLELISKHCGLDRAAKTAYQMSVANSRDFNTFERSRLSTFPQVADPILQKAVVLIEGRSGKDCSITALSAEIGLSERQLVRRFQKQFGITPKKYIVQIKLRHARWMVLNTHLDITSIAYETGFSDCAYFIRCFRNEFGQTPLQFRLGATPTPEESDLAVL
jgi:transcriptional regulator GlxA family with amidase domain